LRESRARNVDGQKVKLDMRLSVLKPLLPSWIKAAWKRLVDDPEMVIRAWKKAMFSSCFETAVRDAAYELHDQGKLFPANASPDKAPGVEPEESPDVWADLEENEDELLKLRNGLNDIKNDPLVQEPSTSTEPRHLTIQEQAAEVARISAMRVLPAVRGRGRGGRGSPTF
jgi:hypothetical protein